MNLLRPTQTLRPAEGLFSGFSPPASSGRPFDRLSRAVSSPLPEIVEEAEKVYVAVGRSVGKALALLRWVFGWFENQEICILHVHQPSPFIPTLLGRLPASQANSNVVSAFRQEEKAETKKILSNYVTQCSKLKVKASIIMTEADQVQNGIVDLIKRHNIQRLVIGAIPDCVKAKKCSRKASYAAENAPLFCQIWFVNQGKLFWKREASEFPSSVTGINLHNVIACGIGSCSLHPCSSDVICHPSSSCSSSSRSVLFAQSNDWIQAEEVKAAVLSKTYDNLSSARSFSSGSGYSSSSEQKSSESDSKFEEESLHNQLKEIKIEAELSKTRTMIELLKRKKLESRAMNANIKVKSLESAHSYEHELRIEAEGALQTTIQECQRLREEKEKITHELRMALRSIALLDSHVEEVNCRCEEASEELSLIQTSIATLAEEKHNIQMHKIEAADWLNHWKSQGQDEGASVTDFPVYGGTPNKFTEFSLIDMQTATCNFSKSFKIGQGEYGVVYKGEVLNRTVAIKLLHQHNMDAQSEFQQEAELLGKLKHPHLVNLIGMCPESWSLVYDYLPNGSLEDHLMHRRTTLPLKWTIRARIVAEIANALLFLHSSTPGKNVHGALKPQNILLDFELRCKISDYGIFRLVPEQVLRCPSFRHNTEPKGAFSYRDPEFHRTGVLSPMSDLYSFGLIILQLVTGRKPMCLASEVRKAMSCGKLASILDPSSGDWHTYAAKRLIDLGLQFCELNSRDRPALTPILVKELEQLHVLEEQVVPSFFVCPILQEIMLDPQIAADGFTYEGEALRGWFENAHETSPMTNLKLSHLYLTPNHALRLAIQEWLCKSTSS